MDFTHQQYKVLLVSFKENDYEFQTFEAFIQNPSKRKTVVLRHDVDRLPENALKLAEIEKCYNIKASYFFRVVSHVWDEKIIKYIVKLGHEIAYHYEDLTITKGDYQKAIKHFDMHLQQFRKFYNSKTICMHGSPISKWDNRNLWKEFSYMDYGIIAEPYFDVDYNKVLYITDTGRRWNKEDISVRDKVRTAYDIKIKSTPDLINKINNKELPDQIIINIHPHRWFNNFYGWFKELIIQNIKNVIKFLLIKLT